MRSSTTKRLAASPTRSIASDAGSPPSSSPIPTPIIPKGRSAWAGDLRKLEALHHAVVVAGHKRDAADTDSPGALEATRAYVMEFDRELNARAGAADVEAEMLRLHPAYGYPLFLKIASRSAQRAAP